MPTTYKPLLILEREKEAEHMRREGKEGSRRCIIPVCNEVRDLAPKPLFDQYVSSKSMDSLKICRHDNWMGRSGRRVDAAL